MTTKEKVIMAVIAAKDGECKDICGIYLVSAKSMCNPNCILCKENFNGISICLSDNWGKITATEYDKIIRMLGEINRRCFVPSYKYKSEAFKEICAYIVKIMRKR